MSDKSTAGIGLAIRSMEHDLRPPGDASGSGLRHRALTLMRSDSVAGAVQVWAPRKAKLYGPALLFGLVSLLYTYECLTFSVFSASLLASLAILCIFFGLFIGYSALAVLNMMRPCYLTTDGGGIGITTRQGTRALRWDEILTLRRIDDVYQGLRLEAPDQVDINLTAHSRADQQALFSLVATAADLHPHPMDETLFVAPAAHPLRSLHPGAVAPISGCSQA